MSETTPVTRSRAGAILGTIAGGSLAGALVLVSVDDEPTPIEIRVERPAGDLSPIRIDREAASELLGCSEVSIYQSYTPGSPQDRCIFARRPSGGTALDVAYQTALRSNCTGTLTVIARCSSRSAVP